MFIESYKFNADNVICALTLKSLRKSRPACRTLLVPKTSYKLSSNSNAI